MYTFSSSFFKRILIWAWLGSNQRPYGMARSSDLTKFKFYQFVTICICHWWYYTRTNLKFNPFFWIKFYQLRIRAFELLILLKVFGINFFGTRSELFLSIPCSCYIPYPEIKIPRIKIPGISINNNQIYLNNFLCVSTNVEVNTWQ